MCVKERQTGRDTKREKQKDTERDRNREILHARLTIAKVSILEEGATVTASATLPNQRSLNSQMLEPCMFAQDSVCCN